LRTSIQRKCYDSNLKNDNAHISKKSSFQNLLAQKF
jgi:hypothetical protein